MSKRIKRSHSSQRECPPSSSVPGCSSHGSLSSSSVSVFSVGQNFNSNENMEVVPQCDSVYWGDRFLGLSFEIWMQIFHYAGIICPCTIKLVTVNHRPIGTSTSTHVRDTDIVSCALFRSPSQVCRHTSFLSMLAVSSQARQLTRKAIFQESLLCFTLRTREDLMGLKQTLRGFPRMAPLERSLRKIQVELKSYDGRRLKGTDKKKPAVNLYKSFCEFAGDKLQGTLKNYIVKCHVSDEMVTRELIDQTKNSFQMLNSCAFRFGSLDPDSRMFRPGGYWSSDPLMEITRNAATKMVTYKEHTAQPFRFMDLPNEIKEMILKEALINFWDPKPYVQQLARRGYLTLPREHLFNIHGGFQYVYRDLVCCSDCLARSTRGCYCFFNRSYSTSCTCFTSPVPIFLTSKFMYNMASHIFFSQTTFVLGYPKTTVDMLSKIPEKHLRLAKKIVVIVHGELIHREFNTCMNYMIACISKFEPKQFTIILEGSSTHYTETLSSFQKLFSCISQMNLKVLPP